MVSFSLAYGATSTINSSIMAPATSSVTSVAVPSRFDMGLRRKSYYLARDNYVCHFRSCGAHRLCPSTHHIASNTVLDLAK